MKIKTAAAYFLNHKPVFSALIYLPLLFALAGRAQSIVPGSEWTHLASPPANKSASLRAVLPLRGEMFSLDRDLLRTNYAKIRAGEPTDALRSGRTIALPMPDGTTARFAVVDAPVMAPELAAKFPEIKTYAGQGLDDPQASVRLDWTPSGFHAQMLTPRGAVYVDPAYRDDTVNHVSYFKRDFAKTFDDWNCAAGGGTNVAKTGSGAEKKSSGATANKIQSGATLRTYRLAVACTGEYAAFFGGTVSNAMAAIVSAVNRVDGVYETELAVRMVLVGNNNLIVFTNAATDPYTNSDGSLMLVRIRRRLIR